MQHNPDKGNTRLKTILSHTLTDIDSTAFQIYDIYQIYHEVTSHARF